MSSAHEKWGQKQKCCVYNFVQYIFLIMSQCLFVFFHYKDKTVENENNLQNIFCFSLVFRTGLERCEDE